MRPLSQWPVEARRHIIGVFTDIDDTLTTEGAITADALQALADLKAAGLHVIPITGRPVGWTAPLAVSWPVDAIVVENGAVALKMLHSAAVAKDVVENTPKIGIQPAFLLPGLLSKIYQQDATTRADNLTRMARIAQRVLAQVPAAVLSRDHAGRETDLAFDYKEFEDLPPETVQDILAVLQQAGMQTAVSSIHIHGSFGHFDKWQGACWIVRQLFQRDLAQELDRWVFVGDSGNDQAMFQHFTHTVGVANIRRFEAQLQHRPRYITRAERGAGFAEVARAVLTA
ncbi:MAG: HAD hydrolase family protein [Burkholderiaceae bacterium]|nr:HAD hydrolase family protein [Burkholderiaceae bacterium]